MLRNKKTEGAGLGTEFAYLGAASEILKLVGAWLDRTQTAGKYIVKKTTRKRSSMNRASARLSIATFKTISLHALHAGCGMCTRQAQQEA
jgi:hypothetical protein